MDNLEYLSQISASTPASAPVKPPLFSKKLKILLISAVVLIIGLFIFGLSSGGQKSPAEKLSAVNIDSTILSEIITTYRPSLKSTKLRSESASITTLLGNVSSLVVSTGQKPPDNKALTAVRPTYAKFESDLEHAKLNGYLDRVFAREVSLELTLINTELTDLANSSKSEPYYTNLINIIESLTLIRDNLKSFSEV